jgi:hypothetical protein
LAARLRESAGTVVECGAALATRPGGILGALIADGAPPAEWRHYPAGEVYDPHSHAQYFYHAHPAAQRAAGEHGHFHTFLRAEGMPAGAAPLVLPETALAGAPSPPQAAPLRHGMRDEVSHLVAVALDERGEPVRLFTTNRWVTGETWYRAEDVIGMLDRFTLGEEAGPALVNRWLAALVALFRPQVEALLRLRDRTVMDWRRRRRSNVFEDTRLEVASSIDIDLGAQLAWLAGPSFAVDDLAARSAVSLPSMAEGWGEG